MSRFFSRRCRYCQEEIEETDQNCPHCGEEFPENEPPIGARTSKAYHKGMSYAADTSSLNKDMKYKEKKQSCFIATAAYGTTWVSEVKHLRNWRDSSLIKRRGGKLFINLYYKVSPPIAQHISRSELLKKLARWGLSPVIHHIKGKY